MFVGFCLLIVGTWLYLFEITQGGKFLAVMGLVYFGISVVLTLIHDAPHGEAHASAARMRLCSPQVGLFW
jgi:uncharacterized membrane protein YiaA